MAYNVERCLLREQLRKVNMTQQELANRLGITKQQVNKYVKKEHVMTLKTAKNIAEILNCDIGDLYEWRLK